MKTKKYYNTQEFKQKIKDSILKNAQDLEKEIKNEPKNFNQKVWI